MCGMELDEDESHTTLVFVLCWMGKVKNGRKRLLYTTSKFECEYFKKSPFLPIHTQHTHIMIQLNNKSNTNRIYLPSFIIGIWVRYKAM